MDKSVAIIGLGYVGLPLACLCARKGFEVFGLELDESKIKKINRKKSPIKDEFIEASLKKFGDKIHASSNKQVLQSTKTIIVCVPTPVDKNRQPDLFALKASCETISKNLRKGQIIIVESTIFPGTIEEIVKPILEQSGLKCEKDFFLAHCPERIDPGNKEWTIENIPRVLGGLSEQGSSLAKKFYKSILDSGITILKSAKEAEAVKVTENSFRDVNIAFVNELAKSFDKMGIDIVEVIRGAATKPFGFMPFYPGPGVGGHCIPVDPYYLIEKAKSKGFEPKFLQLARSINNSMPRYVVSLVEKKLGALKGKNISVLGIAYKADIDDLRGSPSLKIIEILKEKKAVVKTFDPFILNQSNCDSLEQSIKNADCVIVATDHKIFKTDLSADFLKENNVKSVFDARSCLDEVSIKQKGIFYFGLVV